MKDQYVSTNVINDLREFHYESQEVQPRRHCNTVNPALIPHWGKYPTDQMIPYDQLTDFEKELYNNYGQWMEERNRPLSAY